MAIPIKNLPSINISNFFANPTAFAPDINSKHENIRTLRLPKFSDSLKAIGAPTKAPRIDTETQNSSCNVVNAGQVSFRYS